MIKLLVILFIIKLYAQNIFTNNCFDFFSNVLNPKAPISEYSSRLTTYASCFILSGKLSLLKAPSNLSSFR